MGRVVGYGVGMGGRVRKGEERRWSCEKRVKSKRKLEKCLLSASGRWGGGGHLKRVADAYTRTQAAGRG